MEILKIELKKVCHELESILKKVRQEFHEFSLINKCLKKNPISRMCIHEIGFISCL